MKVIICLMREQSMIDETEFSSENLSESAMKSFLSGTYQLLSGYEITYVDLDGDEITVEFDDDYEVAKITHQQEDSLKLYVKVYNQQWLAQFGEPSLRKPLLNISLHSSTDEKTEVIASINHETQPATNTQKIDSTSLIRNKPCELKAQHTPTEILEDTSDKNNQTQQIQQQIKPKIKTLTESSSQEQADQLLHPCINTRQISDQNSLEAPDQQTSQTKIEKLKEQLKPKKEQKKKKKDQKQKKSLTQKPQKKKEPLTEKQIKKLIVNTVLQLMQLQKQHQNEKQFPLQLSANFSSSTCSKCEQKLTVPFYINSSKGVKLCKDCEEQDQSFMPLIKIKDPQMIGKLIWGEPLCQVAKACEANSAKFYTEMKKSLLDDLRQKMNRRIKQAKTQAKNEKAEQKKKKCKQKQGKQSNQDLEFPIDSGSSSV